VVIRADEVTALHHISGVICISYEQLSACWGPVTLNLPFRRYANLTGARSEVAETTGLINPHIPFIVPVMLSRQMLTKHELAGDVCRKYATRWTRLVYSASSVRG